MGLLDSLKKRVKKSVKKISAGAKQVVKSAVKKNELILKGDIKGSVKEWGKIHGASQEVLRNTDLFTDDVDQKIFAKDWFNKSTFNTGREINRVHTSDAKLMRTGEINGQYVKDRAALAAKFYVGTVAAGYAAANGGLTATQVGTAVTVSQKATTGDTKGAALAVVGASGSENLQTAATVYNYADKANQAYRAAKARNNQVAMQKTADGSYVPATENQLANIGIPVAIAAVGLILLMRKK